MRFLIDEMFPPRAGGELAALGHDAVHVQDRGLAGRPDAEVAALAVAEERVLVTENVRDFAAINNLIVVCVLKTRLRRQSLVPDLVALLHAWTQRSPQPYPGLHWPADTKGDG